MLLTRKISEKISLQELETQFGLVRAQEPDFLGEIWDNLPALNDFERSALDRIKHNYNNLSQGSQLSENLVKMTVLSPLLDLAGFYSSNFLVRDEVGVKISAVDAGTVYRGRIDIVVFQNQFWVLVIESKSSSFALNKAIPQALTYMLNSPNSPKSTYGFVLNGSNFRFIKLLGAKLPQYALSDELLLDRGDDFPLVLCILKQIVTLMVSSKSPVDKNWQ